MQYNTELSYQATAHKLLFKNAENMLCINTPSFL